MKALFGKLSSCQIDKIEVEQLGHPAYNLTSPSTEQKELLARIGLKSLLNYKVEKAPHSDFILNWHLRLINFFATNNYNMLCCLSTKMGLNIKIQEKFNIDEHVILYHGSCLDLLTEIFRNHKSLTPSRSLNYLDFKYYAFDNPRFLEYF